MIRIRQIKVEFTKSNVDTLKEICASKLKIKVSDIKSFKINKKSIDARKKPLLYFVYEIDIEVNNEDKILKNNKSLDILRVSEEEYQFKITGNKKLNNRPVIIGSGPAGLFCAYILAENGYKPIIIERGEKIEERVKTVETFWKNGNLNPNSNVQFGEGGAGTFSDGKLNTQVKDKENRKKKIFDTFINCGAASDIAYESHPHIGTDMLRNVVINMRNKIIKMGGEFKYNTCLTDIKVNNNKLESIILNKKQELKTDVLVLAIGHSARDTFNMLYKHNLMMEPKPFAIGVRIQHPQKLINKNQYGMEYHELLEAANYKLTYKASNNRGVYSFCMCPGGYVVNSTSEENRTCINGMSNHARDSKNANSAIIVTVSPKDFGNNPLDGIKFQEKLEEKTYKLGSGKIPVQLFKDYKNNIESTKLGNIEPIFKGEYTLANINTIFPDYINEALKEGIAAFDKNIKGFASDDAILSAIESRTSSPVRIVRNEYGISSIDGIYPCGEGAGYAGGITSAAIDGIKIAEFIASIYKN